MIFFALEGICNLMETCMNINGWLGWRLVGLEARQTEELADGEQ
jgi:hypothetical protein